MGVYCVGNGYMLRTLNVQDKLKLFQAFILSQFNYCPLVWHFCSVSNMKKIEKIQARALRYVYNDFHSSYFDLRARSSRPLMYVQRLRGLMIEVFKIINKEGPTYLHDMITVKETHYNVRNFKTLQQPKYKTIKYGFNSFRYHGAMLWNLLDNEFKKSVTVKDFKNMISKWQEPKCNCNNCNMCMLSNI